MVRKRCLCRMMIPCESARLRFLMFFFHDSMMDIWKPGGLWCTERPLLRAGSGRTWSWKRPNLSFGGELAGKKLHPEDWESQLRWFENGILKFSTNGWNMGEIWWTYCQVCFWYKQFLCTGTILKRQTQTVRLDFQLFLAEFAQCLCADATLRWILTTQKEWGQIAWDE